MTKINDAKKNLLGVVVIVIVIVCVVSAARAQSPEAELHLTWHAATYTPLSYSGKSLPTGKSVVTAAVDVFRSGHALDLTNQQVYWYINSDLIASGLNQWQATFETPEVPLGTLDLRVEVPGYNLLRTVKIPLSFPLAVIEDPLPNKEFQASRLSFYAQPYFFNVTDATRLAYNWQVNGQPPDTSENPNILTLSINPGTRDGFPIDLAVQIQNPLIELENGASSVHIIFRR